MLAGDRLRGGRWCRAADRPDRRAAADRARGDARAGRRGADRRRPLAGGVLRRPRCHRHGRRRACCRRASPAWRRTSSAATRPGRWATSSARSRSPGSSATRSSACSPTPARGGSPTWCPRRSASPPCWPASRSAGAGDRRRRRDEPDSIRDGLEPSSATARRGAGRSPSWSRYSAWTAELTYAAAFYIRELRRQRGDRGVPARARVARLPRHDAERPSG